MKESALLEEIHHQYKKNLKYLTTLNKKLLICFAGIPGSGKTFFAKIIEGRYKAIRLRSDDIRQTITLLEKKYPELLKEKIREEMLQKYVVGIIENNRLKNKRIILDSGIERKYELVKKIADKQKYKLILIQIDVTKNAATNRAHQRKGKIDEHFNQNIDRWIKEYEAFTQKVKSNIIINNERDIKPDLEPIFKALDRLISR